ncbi:hypothetical protein BVY04_04645 [bacterium M21]|nr:hypothetical protein BVY04_04645 [bacterium M21]
MSAVEDSVVEALAATNLTSLCDQRIQLANLANANLIANTNLSMQNAVTNQQELNKIGLAVLGQSVRMISGTDAK